MATKITTCENCKSTRIKDLNGEIKQTIQKEIVYIKAKLEG